MRTRWGTRRRGERGATAVEYGLLVVGIAAATVLPLAGITNAMNFAYSSTCADIVRHDPPPARTCE